jgi:hypothetical protein
MSRNSIRVATGVLSHLGELGASRRPRCRSVSRGATPFREVPYAFHDAPHHRDARTQRTLTASPGYPAQAVVAAPSKDRPRREHPSRRSDEMECPRTGRCQRCGPNASHSRQHFDLSSGYGHDTLAFPHIGWRTGGPRPAVCRACVRTNAARHTPRRSAVRRYEAPRPDDGSPHDERTIGGRARAAHER